jgi:hypothetical protein
MADGDGFLVDLDGLDRVVNEDLPEVVTSAERVTRQVSKMPDALPLSEPFPVAGKINQSYAELREVLADKHATAAQVLQDTTNALGEIARAYRVADGQS